MAKPKIAFPFSHSYADVAVTQGWGGPDGRDGASVLTTGKEDTHNTKLFYGVDFDLPEGEAVLAVASGEVIDVVKVGEVSDPAMGTFVTVRYDVPGFDNNDFYATYMHLSRADVSVGTEVDKGDRIGAVGSTGKVTGPHLHFQVGESDYKSSQSDDHRVADASKAANRGGPILYEGTDKGTVWAKSYEGWRNGALKDDPEAYADYQRLENRPPVVDAVDQTMGLKQWHRFIVDKPDWFSANDPDGDQITHWAFYDGTSNSRSGKFRLDGEASPKARKVFVVDDDDLPDLSFGGARKAGSDELFVAASDGKVWSEWAALTVDEALLV